MARIFLQNMIEGLEFDSLPANWNSFDLESFSRTKKLWDYQQSAVKNAIKVLWRYYEDFVDYQEGESLEVNRIRKQKFFKWYKNNGLDGELDIKLDKRKGKIYSLLTEYYSQENGKIPYENFINRISFWMATGSGKSLVIIKLIQILFRLIERKEIPPCDILILTHRDDLIDQLKRHVEEFNYAKEPKIILKELKEYPEVKRQQRLFGITAFYYRSDNLSDEQKEKIVDFKNYDNDGKWYIFLDEAHKGDKEESKRQHIYSILSRNGFLFNFSATFTDIRDIITCGYEFNLSSFIEKGYGKHILILEQEIRAFRDDEDYNDEEKQKVVLKSLILLTYIKKFYENIKKIQPDLYHKPLFLTLVNSVNTEDADLKLFFRELEKIGKGEIDNKVFEDALNELWNELRQEPEFFFEEEKIKIDEKVFKGITKEDVLRYVYNSETNGEIEVLRRPSNKKELAFKLRTSERPFALIKIGDVSEWLKNKFSGYEVQERFEDESYFETLNREDSEINILMGSRSFYEGWDSNRPNVINFINIGMGEEARKFILQSIGRGVRIEPIKGKRRRLLVLYNAGKVDKSLFDQIKDKVIPLETLFIFATKRSALEKVFTTMHEQKERRNEYQLSKHITINPEAKDRLLLVPIYKQADHPILEKQKQEQVKFEMWEQDLVLLKSFVNFLADDRIFLMRYNTDLKRIRVLKDNLKTREIFKISENVSFKDVDLLIQRIFDYLNVFPEEFKGLKELEEEIRHFKDIKVYLKDVSELQKRIERVKDYPNRLRELNEQYGKIPMEEYIEKARTLREEEDFVSEGKGIRIKYIPNHYYLPLVLSEAEKVDYIKHIIKTQSEVNFINDLEKYLEKSENKFKEFDWWMFSKLDESLDDVYIPYYNPNSNTISKFKPDFIFWLKKGNNYYILFVDPKGIEHISGWKYKVDGYKGLFEENNEDKSFSYGSLNIKIILKLRPTDYKKAPSEYKKYWFDKIEDMLTFN